MLLHILLRQIVDRENAVLAARLNRHICNGKTVVHGKILYAIPDKFHGFVQSTIHTDHADDM